MHLEKGTLIEVQGSISTVRKEGVTLADCRLLRVIPLVG